MGYRSSRSFSTAFVFNSGGREEGVYIIFSFRFWVLFVFCICSRALAPTLGPCKQCFAITVSFPSWFSRTGQEWFQQTVCMRTLSVIQGCGYWKNRFKSPADVQSWIETEGFISDLSHGCVKNAWVNNLRKEISPSRSVVREVLVHGLWLCWCWACGEGRSTEWWGNLEEKLT